MGKIDDFKQRVVSSGTGQPVTPATSEAPKDFLRDRVDANTAYSGEAAVGTPTDQPGWLIAKELKAGTLTALRYAGNGLPNAVWDDRLTLNYSPSGGPIVVPPPPPPPPSVDYTYSDLLISDMNLSVTSHINSTNNIYGAAHQAMYANNRGCPTWWNSAYNNSTDDWWEAIAGWWVGHPEAGHTAVNSKIEIGTYLMLGRRASDNAWYEIVRSASSWAGIFDPNVGAPISAVTPTAGTISGYTSKIYNLPTDGTGNTLHGGVSNVPIDPQTLNAIAFFVAARLTGSDTNLCHYTLQVGADFYPKLGFSVNNNPPGWMIACAASGPKTVTTSWQTFCCAPLSSPGRHGLDSSYLYRRPNDLIPNASILAPNEPIPNPLVIPA